jgi:Putative Ig domain
MSASGLPKLAARLIPRSSVVQRVQNKILLGLLVGLATVGCSSLSAAQVAGSSNSNSIPTITPADAVVSSGAKVQFTASFNYTANTSVIWRASAGTISHQGLFTAPTVKGKTTVTVTAISGTEPTSAAARQLNPANGPVSDINAGGNTATVQVTVEGQSADAQLEIYTHDIEAATVNSPYLGTLNASGGQRPYIWTLASGSLPLGVILGTAGRLRGIPTQPGSFSFVAEVRDKENQRVTASFTLVVDADTAGGDSTGFDGPAELPKVYVQSALANTPAPGSTIQVNARGNLQRALDSAECGQTIALEAGATFSGNFTVPAKSCDDDNWIIIRTNAPDSALPPEGTRITPCYAGVASLPGRPSFSCSSTNNVMAKIVFTGVGSRPITLAPGVNHVRFLGLEITRTSPGHVVFNLVSLQNGGPADHLVFDRVWIHGTAQDDTTRGIELGGSTYVAVVDSFFSDFHCVATTGACGDAQAINGGLGDLPMGPYKINDNFLEASGEVILFGGGAATQNPQDIQISQNHLFKPLIWLKGQPGFVGGRDGNPFFVKNHLELKNAVRVLFEGNVLENTWGGFSQTGFSILLTPKNQNGLCPLCVVHDITIRYSTISHVGSGFQIGNGQASPGELSQGAWNESIHDIVIDDIDSETYHGGGYVLQEANGNPKLAIHDVVVNHMTAVGPSVTGMLVVGNNLAFPAMNNFTWTNSILAAGKTGIVSTGGGSANCAFHPGGAIAKLNACFKPYVFSKNAVIGAAGNWPAGNYAPATADEIQFLDYNNGSGGNYQLQPSSPYQNAGTDGQDVGANVSTVNSMIAGVAPK